MAKITLPSLVSGFASLTQWNQALSDIMAEFNSKVLYRNNPTGEANQMENDLDMNSFEISNLAPPGSPNSAARLADVQDAQILGSGAVAFPAQTGHTEPNYLTTDGSNLSFAPFYDLHFDSLAAMMAGTTHSDGMTARLVYYTAMGDGGMGVYYYNASSAAAHNGTTVIKPTDVVGNGRWLRDDYGIDLTNYVTNAKLSKTIGYYECVQTSANHYALTFGGSGAAATAYGTNQFIMFQPDVVNSGATYLNVDGLGEHEVWQIDGSSFTGGEFALDTLCWVIYAPIVTKFILVDFVYPRSVTLAKMATGTASKYIGYDGSGNPAEVAAPATTLTYDSGWVAMNGKENKWVIPDTNHGLGGYPKHIDIYLKCTSADGTFSSGQIIHLGAGTSSGTSNVILPIFTSSTNFRVKLGGSFTMTTFTEAGATQTLVYSKWSIKVVLTA